jgi:hypothetical protein
VRPGSVQRCVSPCSASEGKEVPVTVEGRARSPGRPSPCVGYRLPGRIPLYTRNRRPLCGFSAALTSLCLADGLPSQLTPRVPRCRRAERRLRRRPAEGSSE